MKKDELIAKQKELINHARKSFRYQSSDQLVEYWLKWDELYSDISALEKAEEPVNDSVKVPSEEEIEKRATENNMPTEAKRDGYYFGFINGAKWMKSQVKTIDLRGELVKFLKMHQGVYLQHDGHAEAIVDNFINSKQ